MPDNKTTDATKFLLRLPRKLHRTLSQSATFYSRSLNAEIVYRLEQALDEDRRRREERQKQASEEEQQLKLEKALQRALEKMEQAGFKIARFK